MTNQMSHEHLLHIVNNTYLFVNGAVTNKLLHGNSLDLENSISSNII